MSYPIVSDDYYAHEDGILRRCDGGDDVFCENKFCENPAVSCVAVSETEAHGANRCLCTACYEAYTIGVHHGRFQEAANSRTTPRQDTAQDRPPPTRRAPARDRSTDPRSAGRPSPDDRTGTGAMIQPKQIQSATTGFVLQIFDTSTGKCIRQAFVAGDQTEWEDDQWTGVEPDEFGVAFESFPFDMIQPGCSALAKIERKLSMRTPKDLSREELEEIVHYAQGFLFLDFSSSDPPDGIPANIEFWNPDKCISGADFVEHMSLILGKHDMIPQKLEVVGASRPNLPPA